MATIMIDTAPIVSLDARVILDSAYFPMDNLYAAFVKADDLARKRSKVFKLETNLFTYLSDCKYVYVDKVKGKFHLFISKASHSQASRLILISHEDIGFIKSAAAFIEATFNNLTETIYTEECFDD